MGSSQPDGGRQEEGGRLLVVQMRLSCLPVCAATAELAVGVAAAAWAVVAGVSAVVVAAAADE